MYSRLGTFVDSCSSLGLLDARSAHGRLDARPDHDVGAPLCVRRLVLGGVEGHLPVGPGGVNLLAVWLLGPGHGVVVVGLHIVDRVLDGLLLAVVRLRVVLGGG